ncbi:MAG: substrate-binding domain-containing protein [Brevinema sp.]
MIQKDIPLVVIGTLDSYEKKILSVDNDNVYDAYNATMIAYQKGHQRVAYLSGDLDFIVYQQRLQGYHKAVSKKKAHAPMIYGLCEDREKLEIAIKMMMENNSPDAIIVKDDIKGVYTINILQKLGYTVGKDVGVIGIGGVISGTFCSPQLITMRFSIENILENAIEKLSEQIQTKKILPGQYIIPTELLDRESLPPRN